MTVIVPIFLGALFGFSLNKAGLTKYHRNNCHSTDLACYEPDR